MKLMLLLPLATLVSAGEYSAKDREAALSRLRASRQSVALLVSGMTSEQSNFKLNSETWSVTEVIEHLVLAEDFLLGFLKSSLAKTQPLPDDQPLPNPAAMDKTVFDSVSDRSQKAKAPDEARPKGEFSDWEAALKAFGEKRGATFVFVEEQKNDLRRFFVESPGGKLDGHQWLLLIAAHTERHAKQIAELMKNENFPKSN